MVAAFNNLSVSTKIFSGFGVVLAILCILGATNYFSAEQIRTGFATFEQRVHVAEMISDIDLEFTRARRHVREFALTGAEEAAKSASETFEGLKRQVTAAIEEITAPERGAMIRVIESTFAEYVRNFGELQEILSEKSRIIKETLDPTGAQLREDIEALYADAERAGNPQVAKLSETTAMHMMRIRLAVNKYLGRRDDSLVESISALADQLKADLSRLDEATHGTSLRAGYQQIAPLVAIYLEAYAAVFAHADKADDLVNHAMREEAHAIDETAEKLKESAVAEEKAILESANALIATVTSVTLILTLGSLALGGFLAWMIGRGISSGIIDITGAMSRLAGGDKTFDVPHRGRKDEVGVMAAALQSFKETATEADRLAAEQKTEQEKRLKRAEHVNKLVSSFNDAMHGIVQGVSAGATQLRANAEQLSAIAEETNRQSMTVSAAAEQASTNVETVAASAEELNASIGEINRQINQTSQIATEAGDNVRSTNETVDTLSNAAQEIGNIVKLIQDIAGQTNLLALNATIEAARAGEAGKGFAVVASEVKTLANQTAKATEEIASQIERIQGISKESVDAIAKIGASVGRITEAAATVAAAVNEQSAATSEISGNVQQASVGTREVTSNITQVTQAASETGKMAGDVLSASSELSVQSERLREVVSKFIDEVRAA